MYVTPFKGVCCNSAEDSSIRPHKATQKTQFAAAYFETNWLEDASTHLFKMSCMCSRFHSPRKMNLTGRAR